MSFIYRRKINDKFIYKNAKKEDMERIISLKIPPMWSDVKIDKNKDSKIQAFGYDLKGRKQYIYHPSFIEKGKVKKFKKINTFDYNKYSRVINHYIAKSDLSKNCVIANVLKLMEDLNIRVGNETYKKQNGTHGISTLLKTHFKNDTLSFIGKKGISHVKKIKNDKSLNFIKKVMKIKGPYLFYDSSGYRITSSDLNNFIKDKIQSNITCKDIRTYCANKIFKHFMNNMKLGETVNERKKNIIKGLDHTADQLGNTRKVCRDSYLCPNLIKKFI